MTILTLTLVGRLCRAMLRTSEVAVAIAYAAPWADGPTPSKADTGEVRPAPEPDCPPIPA